MSHYVLIFETWFFSKRESTCNHTSDFTLLKRYLHALIFETTCYSNVIWDLLIFETTYYSSGLTYSNFVAIYYSSGMVCDHFLRHHVTQKWWNMISILRPSCVIWWVLIIYASHFTCSILFKNLQDWLNRYDKHYSQIIFKMYAFCMHKKSFLALIHLIPIDFVRKEVIS